MKLNVAPTLRQKTLKAPIHCRGVGLHTGARISMTLHPAPSHSGIALRRSALRDTQIADTWRNIVESALCTTLASGGNSVATVEHLMAALAGLEIDNVVVELDGPEVP